MKFIGHLRVTDVDVVAFAPLVIETNDADLVADEGQAVFVKMGRADDRDRHFPNPDVHGLILADADLILTDQPRLHVGEYSNRLSVVNWSNSASRLYGRATYPRIWAGTAPPGWR